MSAVVAMTGQGGWPMSVFLTPEGEPFWGGTYFPPVPRYNMPSFRDILTSLAQAWQERRTEVLQSGQKIREHIQSGVGFATTPQDIKPEKLEQATSALAQAYDWKWGGWGSAPKFPQPMVIEYLLRRASREDVTALEMAADALNSMALGGMYDVVGGGFARYSTDNQWLVPHFEKMLYDNAQLALVYLHGHLVCQASDSPEAGDNSPTPQCFSNAFQKVCVETLDFVVRELRHPQGGFFSSLDADSEGEEGKFYVWSADEIREVAGSEEEYRFFQAAYTVTPGGNFEGANALQRRLSDQELAEQFQITPEQAAARLDHMEARLLERRSQRVRPGTDDKVLVSWNALMLAAFAETARYLGREDYLEIARQNANFLLSSMRNEKGLLRSWREGIARHTAYLEDYAALILGLLALYQSDPQAGWFEQARTLTHEMVQRFRDPSGGFFDTADDHETLITRPKDVQDNAVPSGNALAALALLQMAAYTGQGEWRDQAEDMLGAVQEAAARYPTAFGQWLWALDFAAGPVQEVAVLGPDTPERRALVQVIWEKYRPRVVAAVSTFPPDPHAPELLRDRPLVDGQPAAYVCTNFVCLRPVSLPEELEKQLEANQK